MEKTLLKWMVCLFVSIFQFLVEELRRPFESCWDFHSWGCLRFQSVAAVAVVSDLGRWKDDDSQECLGCTAFPLKNPGCVGLDAW